MQLDINFPPDHVKASAQFLSLATALSTLVDVPAHSTSAFYASGCTRALDLTWRAHVTSTTPNPSHALRCSVFTTLPSTKYAPAMNLLEQSTVFIIKEVSNYIQQSSISAAQQESEHDINVGLRGAELTQRLD
jgi:hypothetical protein